MRIASLFKLSSAALLSTVIGAAVLSSSAYARVTQEKDHFFKDGFLSEVNWQVEPYIGADAMTRVMRYKNEPTHPFQEHLDTFQPFVGVKLHKYFGIEAGYQQSEKGTKERFFDGNQKPAFFGGVPMNLLDPGVYEISLDLNTTVAIKGWNVGIVGFYPINKDKTELFAKIGYSNSDLDTEYRFNAPVIDPGISVLPVRIGSAFGHLHDNAGMLHLSLGVKHAFSNNFAGRLFIDFERTARLRMNSRTLLFDQLSEVFGLPAGNADINRDGSISINPHNSWSFGVGLLYTWGRALGI